MKSETEVLGHCWMLYMVTTPSSGFLWKAIRYQRILPSLFKPRYQKISNEFRQPSLLMVPNAIPLLHPFIPFFILPISLLLIPDYNKNRNICAEQ